MLRDTIYIQEKIINAINHFKIHKKKRPSSEEIYDFVTDGSTIQIDFAMFRDAMRQLKIQRRIYNEKRNGVFSYFIPRVPEIILKLDKSNISESNVPKNEVLPLQKHKRRSKSESRTNRKKSQSSERKISSGNAPLSPLTFPDMSDMTPKLPDAASRISDIDSFINDIMNKDNDIIDDDDDGEDIKKLEAFIDKMMDRLDNVVIREPPTNLLSLYEQRIFDLKSEVMFLRKLASSNNTILQEEIRFLREELEAKNVIIKQLTETLNTTNSTALVTIKEVPTEMKEAHHKKNSVTRNTCKPLLIEGKHIEERISEKKKIKMMGESLLREIYDIGMSEATTAATKGKNSGTFSSFDIFDHLKHGIIPRHNGVSFHVDECDLRQNINIPKMFDGIFGSMVNSPYRGIRDHVVITEIGNESLNTTRQKKNENDNINENVNVIHTTTHSQKKEKEEEDKENMSETLYHNIINTKVSKMSSYHDSYRGWLSLDIMDNIKPSLKKQRADESILCFGSPDLNLLKICENMSEQVNSINVKLRNYCEQRRIIYDGGVNDDPCKLLLNCKSNNLLTNSYVNCRIAT